MSFVSSYKWKKNVASAKDILVANDNTMILEPNLIP